MMKSSIRRFHAFSVGAVAAAIVVSGCAATTQSVEGDGASDVKRGAAQDSAANRVVTTPAQLRSVISEFDLVCKQGKQITWRSTPGDAFKLPVGPTVQRTDFEWPLTQADATPNVRALGIGLSASGLKDSNGNPQEVALVSGASLPEQSAGNRPICSGDAASRASMDGFILPKSFEESGFRVRYRSSRSSARDGVQCLTARLQTNLKRPRTLWGENCTTGTDVRQEFFWDSTYHALKTNWDGGYCVTLWDNKESLVGTSLEPCGDGAERQEVSVAADGRLTFPGAKRASNCAMVLILSPVIGGKPESCDRFEYPPTRQRVTGLKAIVSGAPPIEVRFDGDTAVADCEQESKVILVGCQLTGLLAPDVEGDLRTGVLAASYWNLPLTVGVVNKAPGLIAVSGEKADLGDADTPSGDPLGTRAAGVQRVGVVKPRAIPYNGTVKLPFLREMTAPPALTATAGTYAEAAPQSGVTVDKNKVTVRIATTASSAKDMEQCLETSKVGSKAWAQNCGFVDVTIKSVGGSAGTNKLTQLDWTCEVAGVNDKGANDPNFKRISVDFLGDAKGDRSSLGAAGYLDPIISVNAARSGVGRECKSRKDATGELWFPAYIPKTNGGN